MAVNPREPDDELFDAVRTALASWLEARLTPLYPELVVWDDWPDPGQELPPYALTVLAAGDADIEYHPPVDMTVTLGTSPNGAVVYQYGWANELPLQVDVFALSATARDALLRDLARQLNVSPQVSLAGTAREPASSLPDYGSRSGLTLVLPDRWQSLGFYNFTSTAASTQTSSQAQAAEWRAVLRGSAQCAILAEETMPLIKRIEVRDPDLDITLEETAP